MIHNTAGTVALSSLRTNCLRGGKDLEALHQLNKKSRQCLFVVSKESFEDIRQKKILSSEK